MRSSEALNIKVEKNAKDIQKNDKMRIES